MDARLSDGTRTTTGGTWGSDAPSVATIDATGLLQVLGIGEATIYVDFQGQRATRRLRSTVRYEGVLETTARATRCTHTGGHRFWDVCSLYPIGSELQDLIYARFEQDGDRITAFMEVRYDGTWGLEKNPFPAVTTTVNRNGDLRIDSTRDVRYDHSPEWAKEEGQWVLKPVGLTQIGGTWVFRRTGSGNSGYVEVEATITPVAVVRPTSPGSAADSSGPPVVAFIGSDSR